MLASAKPVQSDDEDEAGDTWPVGGLGRYPYNRGSHLIMTIDLHAYADESGIEGDSLYCIVAGFVGSPRWWDKFNADWRAIINAAPDDVEEFHAKDFFERNHAAKKNSERNPFRSWSGASAFLATLVDVIVRYRGKIK